MTAMTHVGPEEVMVWMDGELPESEARAVESHVAECAECAAVAAGFRAMSEQLGEWRVEEVPEKVEAAVMGQARRAKDYAHGRPSLRSARTWGTRMRWGMGLGGALAAMMLLAVVPAWYRGHQARTMYDMLAPAPNGPVAVMDGIAPMEDAGPAQVARARVQEQAVRSELEEAKAQADKSPAGGGGGPIAAVVATPPAVPMIARTVSLTVRVQDVDVSRAAVEGLLARHHGYAAQINASTAEGAARTFTASLRIPAPELAAALKELRGLGKVENESQNGEEVTQQHQDLVARLKNSRETEARLQAILQQRTGRISDVLEVEQEIARVRGEIESMEAEQAGLEHRVDFASVDLSLAEEYKAEFRTPDSAGTRLRNAMVAGYENAGDTVLGIVLFAEEYGPALMVWVLLLALPGLWVWRRYRRALRVG